MDKENEASGEEKNGDEANGEKENEAMAANGDG